MTELQALALLKQLHADGWRAFADYEIGDHKPVWLVTITGRRQAPNVIHPDDTAAQAAHPHKWVEGQPRRGACS